MKLLQGYVENSTVAISLTAIFSALFVATRPLVIPIAPGVVIAICGSFLYLTPLFLPWKYTWVLPFLVAYTGSSPIRNFITVTAGTQTCYFTSRLLSKTMRFQVLSTILATYVTNMVGSIVRHLMGTTPIAIGFPACMVKATVTAASLLIIVPVIIEALKATGVVNFEES